MNGEKWKFLPYINQLRYSFGYNGMGKVNEWSGIGNHNTAKFWEYDTRTGRRLNLDPVINTALSPYGAFDLSPVWKGDKKGNIGKILTITLNARSNSASIQLSTVNKVMTNGVQHQVWDDESSYHWENYYYDYNRVNVLSIDENGQIQKLSSTSYIPKGNPVKNSENVWFGGDKKGDTKIESWNKMFSMTNILGGFIVYGSASDNSESPGVKGFQGKIRGSIDMNLLNDVLVFLIQLH